MRNTWKRAVAAMGLAAGMTWGAAHAESGDPKWTFRVPEPFRVGATVYPAGTLSVRNVQRLNPVSMIQAVWVNDVPLGFMTVRTGRSEAPVRVSTALFERHGTEPLVLVGYSVPGRRTGTVYKVPAEAGSAVIGQAGQTLIVSAW